MIAAGQEADRDTRRTGEETDDRAADSALGGPLLRDMVVLVDVQIVTGEGPPQEQVPAVVAFHEADVPRPRRRGAEIGAAARTVARGGVSLHRVPLAVEEDDCHLEAHARKTTPRRLRAAANSLAA